MIINFIGGFDKGYVGEVADETHLVRELRALGHRVQCVPRDIWKGYCDGDYLKQWEGFLPLASADINIITKWHHFNNEKYISLLRDKTKAPVFYWVWDFMEDDFVMPDFHVVMATSADLYLGNDVKNPFYKNFNNAYYFPFDVSDGDIARETVPEKHKKYDVVFFGSYLPQGDRLEYLREIDKEIPVKIFSWNHEEWKKDGFDAQPAVYGQEFANKVGSSKIILGFSVEPNCWGYWSNRTGKILNLGGFLLYQYAPGMELFLRDGAEYFSSPQEAIQKIKFYLENIFLRYKVSHRGWEIGQDRFSSKARVIELCILIERFLKTQRKNWII